jgi:H+/Cl- antiporter ClcA
MPHYTWHTSASTLLALVLLVVAGIAVTFGLKGLHTVVDKAAGLMKKYPWWFKGAIAALGLSALYLLGGSLVMFTGNESIVPMLEKAPTLGLVGLAWILVIKMAAISWSKSMGYRGGLIFPTVFVASVCVAFSQLIVKDVNFAYGLIAVMVGVLGANNKLKILF